MATIKLGNSKSCSKSVNYAQKKAVVMGGVNCNPVVAKLEMKQVRVLYGKNDKVQAHTIIQSFKPDEVSAELANQIGCQLAEKIAQGYQAAVYTHTDEKHIHNHIIINSVSLETGKKYHSDKGRIEEIRCVSDELCIANNLSIVTEPSSLRFTLAEKAILGSGRTSWKDQIRSAIDSEKQHCFSYDEFKQRLLDKYNIVVNDSGKHITFKHPDHNQVVRGRTLGADYEKESIVNVISGQIKQRKQEERRTGNKSTREIERKSGKGKIEFGKLAFEASIGEVQRELRKITTGIKQSVGDDGRKQEERERRTDNQNQRDEPNSSKFENTERRNDRTDRQNSDEFER